MPSRKSGKRKKSNTPNKATPSNKPSTSEAQPSPTTTTTSEASASSPPDGAKAAPVKPVSTVKQWLTQEDMMKDLWAYSEIPYSQEDRNLPTPLSILEHNARMEANRKATILDMTYDEEVEEPEPEKSEMDKLEEGVKYLSMGRGRGGVSKIHEGVNRAKKAEIEGEQFIQKRIREISSGFGYSDETIMKHRQSYQMRKAETSPQTDPPTAAASPAAPPPPSPKQEYYLPYGHVEDVVVDTEPPPPLSVILGKRKPRKARPAPEPAADAASVATVDPTNVYRSTSDVSGTSSSNTNTSGSLGAWRQAPRVTNPQFFSQHFKVEHDITCQDEFPPLGKRRGKK